MAAADYYTQVYTMFVGYFGRPPAQSGLDYYATKVDAAGGSLGVVIDDFYNSAESQAFFAGKTIEQQVNLVFHNLFGRDAAVAGLNYWTNQIATGKVSLAQAAFTIANGAQAADAAILAAKIDTAELWVASLDTNTEILLYSTDGGRAAGRDFLNGVTTSTAATQAEVDAALLAMVNGGNTGQTFNLTNGTDVATANVFNAGLVYTPGGDDRINSLQDEDILTGTGTNPTLNATLGNANDNGSDIITPKLVGIETLNGAFTGSGKDAVRALDLQDATGIAAINVTRVSAAVNEAEIGNIMTAAAQLSLANTNANNNGTVEFSYATGALAGDNTGTITLDNVNLGARFGALNIGQNTSGIAGRGVGNRGFENLTINSAGAAANVVSTLNLPADTDTDGVVTITGSADLTLGARVNIVNNGNPALTEAAGVWLANTGLAQTGGRLASIDASAFTGNLNLVLDNVLDIGKADTSGVVQNVAVTGGSGNDNFILYDVVQAGDTISGGSGGNDTLSFYSGSALNSVATGIDVTAMYADGSTGNIALDYDFAPDASGVTLRNISSNGVTNAAEGPVTFTLYDMTAAQATGITVQHSTTGNGQIANTIIEAAVKANTASDTVGVTIGEGTNVDPRFNFTLDTVVANTATSTTASASTFENVTITDSDSESNSVELQNFAQHTGTITLTGGRAGTFLNLDVDTAGADVANNAAARAGSSLVLNPANAATGVQQGLYQLNTDGTAVDMNTGNIRDVGTLATQVRLGAATIDASAEVSNVIVRVSTNAADVNGAQVITMGMGDDTVIFDNLNDARAGLTISDTVAGGEGNDTLVIDSNGVIVQLGASEWTNVTGFENLRLVGTAFPAVGVGFPPLLGNNSYNLVLTDAFIGANKGSNGLLNIINDNDSNNDNAASAGSSAGEFTQNTSVESGVTIDARTLAATTHFSYNGEEGSWLDNNANGVYDVGVDAILPVSGGFGTHDRFIFGDANINGGNVIDGGANDNITTTWNHGLYSQNLGSWWNGGNWDVFEVRNGATVTTGDLANVKNIGIIAGTNDQAVAQTLVLQLNDAVVDAMVDSYHTSTTMQQEALWVRMNSALDIVGAVAASQLNLDNSQTTARSIVNVSLDIGFAAVDTVRLGMGQTWVAGYAAADNVVVSRGQFGLTAAIGNNYAATTGGIVYGALGSGATTDRIYVVQSADLDGSGVNDTGIYYDADGSGASAAILIGVLRDVQLSATNGIDVVA
jgi:hypothetical protein